MTVHRFRVEEGLVEAVDRVRGELSRKRFFERAVQHAVLRAGGEAVKLETRPCVVCFGPVRTDHKRRRYCSNACRIRAMRLRRKAAGRAT